MTERQEPYDGRLSRTDLWEPGGEIPPGDPTVAGEVYGRGCSVALPASSCGGFRRAHGFGLVLRAVKCEPGGPDIQGTAVRAASLHVNCSALSRGETRQHLCRHDAANPAAAPPPVHS